MFPVSINEFKGYFLRQAGLEYQPYPTWAKTTWDEGEYCLFNNIFYKSTSDWNVAEPPLNWEAKSEIYIPGTYLEGSVVYYADKFYKAIEDTNENPMGNSWRIINPEEEFPGYREWSAPIAFSKDEKTFSVINFIPLVRSSLSDNNYTDPSDNQFWETDEAETENLQNCVLDSDIERAMGEAMFKFSPRLFSKDNGKIIFLYLTMFFLVYDRQMAHSGLNGNSASGPVIHRTVGKMSVSYMESKMFAKYPSYEFLATNDYGRKAFNLMRPYLTGGIRILRGGSTGE